MGEFRKHLLQKYNRICGRRSSKNRGKNCDNVVQTFWQPGFTCLSVKHILQHSLKLKNHRKTPPRRIYLFVKLFCNCNREQYAKEMWDKDIVQMHIHEYICINIRTYRCICMCTKRYEWNERRPRRSMLCVLRWSCGHRCFSRRCGFEGRVLVEMLWIRGL